MNNPVDSVSFQSYVTPYKELSQEVMTYQDWTAIVVERSIEFGKSQAFQKGLSRQTEAQPWMLSLILFGFVSVAFSRSIYRKRFNMLFASFLNWKLSKQIIRYENIYFHPVNLLMTFNFLFCIPLFFSFFLQAKAGGNYFFHFGATFIPLIIYLLAKWFLYKLSAWLFREEEAIEEYLFQTALFNKYLGVVYLILTTLLLYSSVKIEILYQFGIATLILFLLFQIVRGVIIGIERDNHLLFIILYLCTLEILPWLIMGKWINNYL